MTPLSAPAADREMGGAMDVSVFRVANLLFEGTELGLQRQLEGYPGIESVSVDVGSGIVTVRHDETVLSHRAVRRAIADCGYWSPECESVRAREDGEISHSTHRASTHT